MTGLHLVACVIAVALFVYLGVALLAPERLG